MIDGHDTERLWNIARQGKGDIVRIPRQDLIDLLVIAAKASGR